MSTQFLGRVFEILVKSPWESQLPHTVSCFRSEESLEKICRWNVVSQITTHNRRRPELPQGIKTSSVRKQNAALSESPPLSHLLTHAPTHTHRKHMPWHGGIGSSTRFMPNSHHLLFCEPLKHLNESGPMFTLSGWLMQTVSVRNVRYRLVQPFRVFDQVRAVLLKWRLSLWNTWMCESCSSPVQPRVHPSTDWIQFLNYWQWR